MTIKPESMGGSFVPTCPLRIEDIDCDYTSLNAAMIAIRTECVDGCNGAIEVPYVARTRRLGIGPVREQVCFTVACPEEMPSDWAHDTPS
jgi:hypothetical protein